MSEELSNVFSAHVLPRRMDGDSQLINIALFNPDGSPYEGGGGGLIVSGRMDPKVVASEAYAVFNAAGNTDVLGIPESSGEEEAQLILPPGGYHSHFTWGFANNIDEGADDTVRGFRVWFQVLDEAWGGKSVPDLMRFPDKPAGGWTDHPDSVEEMDYTFVVWTPTRLLISLNAQTVSTGGVDMTATWTIIKVSDIPEIVEA